MYAMEWLKQQPNVGGGLGAEDRNQILEFCLIWTYFESTQLKCECDCAELRHYSARMIEEGLLNRDDLQEHLEFWKQRYYGPQGFNGNFDGLELRPRDNVEIVRNVLSGEADDDLEVMVCLLTIIYRFRNNLFHGVKWAYGIHGQRDNFIHAVGVLTKVMDMAR